MEVFARGWVEDAAFFFFIALSVASADSETVLARI